MNRGSIMFVCTLVQNNYIDQNLAKFALKTPKPATFFLKTIFSNVFGFENLKFYVAKIPNFFELPLGGVNRGTDKGIFVAGMPPGFRIDGGHAPPSKIWWRGKIFEKMSKYLVLKGSKNFCGACGAAKKAL